MMGLLGGAAAIFDVWLGWPLPLTILVTLVMGLLLGGPVNNFGRFATSPAWWARRWYRW
jgi:ABC-type xylose transport system permease subunit